MSLFGHHAKGIIDIEIFGYDLAPDGMTEHIIAVAIVGLAALLMSYGAYALVRDVLRWRRRKETR